MRTTRKITTTEKNLNAATTLRAQRTTRRLTSWFGLVMLLFGVLAPPVGSVIAAERAEAQYGFWRKTGGWWIFTVCTSAPCPYDSSDCCLIERKDGRGFSSGGGF